MKNWGINNIIEKKIIPDWLKEAGYNRCYLYQGSSMEPTFKPGQLLYIRTEMGVILPGDIIVYRDPSKNKVVVHRVVSQSSTGFITRGDNNRHFDTYPVELQHIIGRVELVEDDGHISDIPRGRFTLYKKRLKWGLFRLVRKVFIGPYLLLGKSQFVRNVLRKRLSPHMKIISIKTREGQLYKVRYKDHTIAQWWPQTNRFFCQKPFSLFLSPEDIKQKLKE